MPLTLPNLDDRTYADLVEEAVALIPTYTPEWTNHNPSDPGITQIELFAYLTEMLLYRQNRITDELIRTFLRLINGPDWEQTQALNEEARLAVLGIRERYRAVTVEDMETLPLTLDGVARARALPRRNLEAAEENRHEDAAAHVSIIIVPEQGTGDPEAATLQPDAALIQAVTDDLEPRRLLTTQLHVVGPRYITVGVQLRIILKRDAPSAQTAADIAQALEQFFDPLVGGTEGNGWPFGRPVYVSEVYDLLDRLPGVDYITSIDGQDELTVDADPPEERLLRNSEGELVAVLLQPDELVNARIEEDSLVIESPLQPFRV